jgi:hypothetical protein
LTTFDPAAREAQSAAAGHARSLRRACFAQSGS